MVKITNPLGDFKRGKQGEAVYQGRYGEQIRRTLAPKRAIPSQRQIDHRQLYRAALNWRKALSLPNRRYLDGYCIANWIVDDYKIPLPWSRFALKIYLQAVKFVLSEVSYTPPAESQTKYESYETGENGSSSLYPPYWQGQTFTPQLPHTLTRVVVKAWRKGSPPLIKLVIKECDGAHKPTGSELSSVWKDFSGITPTSPGEWVPIDLPDVDVAADKEYCFYLCNDEGDSNNKIELRHDDSSPTYTRGVKIASATSGETWVVQNTADLMFQEWEFISTPEKKEGILHVRHPALASVLQKRNGKMLKQWSNLSDLDKEYLTGQVGLDVEKGDYIEATTLPDIKYRYTVL